MKTEQIIAKIEALPNRYPVFIDRSDDQCCDTEWFCKTDDLKALAAEVKRLTAPVDMLLFCPKCFEQHVDEPDPNQVFWLIERRGGKYETVGGENVEGRHLWWGGKFASWLTDVNEVPVDARFPSQEMAMAMLNSVYGHYEGDRLLVADCISTEHAIIGWQNPPHRSHLCQFCNHVWRPADVPTNGVQKLETSGKADGSARPVAFANGKDFDDSVATATKRLTAENARLREGLEH